MPYFPWYPFLSKATSSSSWSSGGVRRAATTICEPVARCDDGGGGSADRRQHQEQRARRQQEEMRIAQRFMNVFQNKLDEIRIRMTSQDPDAKFNLEEGERKILLSINNLGLKEGVACGLLSLLFLRKVRSTFLKRIVAQQRKQQRQQQQQQNADGSGPAQTYSSPFQQQQQGQQFLAGGCRPTPSQQLDYAIHQRQRPFSFINVFGWFLDIAVSFSVAATTSLIFTDRKQILNNLSSIPLVEGRSRVADEFCPAVVAEAKSIRDENPFHKDMIDHPQSTTLKALMEFCTNCRRRSAMERRLRQEQGLGESEPVSIPTGGVVVSDDDEDLVRDGFGAGGAVDLRHHITTVPHSVDGDNDDDFDGAIENQKEEDFVSDYFGSGGATAEGDDDFYKGDNDVGNKKDGDRSNSSNSNSRSGGWW